MSKPAASIPEPREFIHVKLKVSVKDLLRRMNFEHRVSLTKILERVIERAEDEGVLVDWIKPPPAAHGGEEAVATQSL
jgi:hypothetical protein